MGRVKSVDGNSHVHCCRDLWAPYLGAIVHSSHDQTAYAELHAQILSVLPLAAVHTLGNLLTNVSLGQVAVSFTHTIKASLSPYACRGAATCTPVQLVSRLSLYSSASLHILWAGESFSCSS